MSKELLAGLDSEIKELKAVLFNKENIRNSIAYTMVSHALNSAPASHRVCCGTRPIGIVHGTTTCDKSPTGVCVYKVEDTPHSECLFCLISEDDKFL